MEEPHKKGRLTDIERRQLQLERDLQAMGVKERKPKIPFKFKGMMKKSLKTKDSVLILYLSSNYKAEFKLSKIISGNLIVIGNKAHVLDPRTIWRFGKYNFYVVREIDRIPVSNEDYDSVFKYGRDTDEDVPLIKAVLGAVQKQTKEASKNIIAVVIIIAVILGGILFFT